MDCARRHAVVTGTSSGIGRATALALTRSGYHVFGTVRTAEDGDVLRKAADGELTPVVMDVTDDEQVAAAAELLDEHLGGGGLDVLVNNAGIAIFEPLEHLPPAKLAWHLQVNAVGPLRVAQAFLPAIRRGRGRIIFIGSMSAWFTTPFGGSHSASKHALFGITEALRQELAPWGIPVSVIEPGTINSPAFDKAETQTDAVLAAMGPIGRARYGDSYRELMARSVEMGRKGSSPDVIAAAVLSVIKSGRPPARRLAGKNARLSVLLSRLPVRLLDSVQRSIFGLPKPGSLRNTATGPVEYAQLEESK